MDQYSLRLLDVCVMVLRPWLTSKFDDIVRIQGLASAVDSARRELVIGAATSHATARLRSLFETDVNEQTTNPLAILRECTNAITDELRRIGAEAIPRDDFHEKSFPHDVFGLCPATWADIDESLIEPGLEWGAFKAATIIQRRRETQQRTGGTTE